MASTHAAAPERGRADAPAGDPDLSRDPLLVMSPHVDDAALSCAALLDRKRPVDVLTVFTGTPDPPQRTEWDRESGFTSSDEAMATRMAEERAAFDCSPHRLHELGELDGQYVPGARDGDVLNNVARFVSTWVREAGPTARVVVPAGAGRRRVIPSTIAHRVGLGPVPHIDHEYVRDAVLGALHPRRAILYEEFPYMNGRRGDRSARRAVRPFGWRPIAFDLPVDGGEKTRRLAAYGSQLETLCVSSDGLPAEERYYRLVRYRSPVRRLMRR